MGTRDPKLTRRGRGRRRAEPLAGAATNSSELVVAVCVHAAVDARPDGVAEDERIDVLLRGLCVRRAATASYKFLLIRCNARRFEGHETQNLIDLAV